jgi:hypothetical protein
VAYKPLDAAEQQSGPRAHCTRSGHEGTTCFASALTDVLYLGRGAPGAVANRKRRKASSGSRMHKSASLSRPVSRRPELGECRCLSPVAWVPVTLGCADRADARLSGRAGTQSRLRLRPTMAGTGHGQRAPLVSRVNSTVQTPAGPLVIAVVPSQKPGRKRLEMNEWRARVMSVTVTWADGAVSRQRSG